MEIYLVITLAILCVLLGFVGGYLVFRRDDVTAGLARQQLNELRNQIGKSEAQLAGLADMERELGDRVARLESERLQAERLIADIAADNAGASGDLRDAREIARQLRESLDAYRKSLEQNQGN